VQLTKHHGLANDFLVVLDESNDGALQVDGELARRVCDRRTGVGADGLIHGAVAPKGSDAELVMHLFNADGSRAEMSGNGIRCLGHAVALARDEQELHLAIETDGGPRAVLVQFRDPDGRVAWTEASMGKSVPGPQIPDAVAERLARPGPAHARRAATADVGNPHLVVEVDDIEAVDLAELGPALEQHFPSGINIELVPPRSDPASVDLPMRVWERGAGVTQACGTGACAVAAVVHDWEGLARGGAERGWRLDVHMPGGTARVVLEDSGQLVLSGDVHHVATIELPDA
jgi:diaminopimelate epimerase